MLKLILRFIPFNSMIDYGFDKLQKMAKKTQTLLDDHIVEVGRHLAKMWAEFALNPSKSLAKSYLRESILKLIDFADDDLRQEVKDKLSHEDKVIKDNK